MKPIRTIGIVNDGGDAPGLNPVTRAIVRVSINEHRIRVVGVLNGFDGLIWPEGAKEMTEESVSGILPRGSTILDTTNRGNPFAYKAIENAREAIHEHSSLCMDNARGLGIDAMIVIGGEGTLDETLEKMKFIDPNMEIVHAARAVGATFGDGR